MSSPYRAPSPPPAELARRMSWWERLWLRARRRWVAWWLTPSSTPRWLDDMSYAHNASIAHLKASSPRAY